MIEKELKILNKGLKFELPPKALPINDLIVHIKSGVSKKWSKSGNQNIINSKAISVQIEIVEKIIV